MPVLLRDAAQSGDNRHRARVLMIVCVEKLTEISCALTNTTCSFAAACYGSGCRSRGRHIVHRSPGALRRNWKFSPPPIAPSTNLIEPIGRVQRLSAYGRHSVRLGRYSAVFSSKAPEIAAEQIRIIGFACEAAPLKSRD